MPAWTDEQIENGGSTEVAEKYVHGLLEPIEATYWRWGDTVDGVKQAAVEITFEEYQKLPKVNNRVDGGGEKLQFTINPKPINPALQFVAQRSVFRGFPDWNRVTAPSILSAVGGDPKLAIKTFRDRANEEAWYVEARMVKVPAKGGKVNEVPQFLRMTQNLEEVIGWNRERYPRHKKNIPEDILNAAKLGFELQGRDKVKFAEWVTSEAEMEAYRDQLVDDCVNW